MLHVVVNQVETACGSYQRSKPNYPSRAQKKVQPIAYQTPERYADYDIE
ncbi:hypothetical protein GCM10009567_08920 [Rothia amarae]